MFDISPAGLLGAAVGTAIAAVAYGPLAALAERRLQALDHSKGLRQGELLERGLLRRVVLAADIFLFSGAGYWLGAAIAG